MELIVNTLSQIIKGVKVRLWKRKIKDKTVTTQPTRKVWSNMIEFENRAASFEGPAHHAVAMHYTNSEELQKIAKQYGVCYIQTRIGDDQIQHHEIKLPGYRKEIEVRNYS